MYTLQEKFGDANGVIRNGQYIEGHTIYMKDKSRKHYFGN